MKCGSINVTFYFDDDALADQVQQDLQSVFYNETMAQAIIRMPYQYLDEFGSEKRAVFEFDLGDHVAPTEPPTGDVDCQGAWSLWGECSTTCGLGMSSRTFTITQQGAGTGETCEAGNGAVNAMECVRSACEGSAVVDVELSFNGDIDEQDIIDTITTMIDSNGTLDIRNV